MFEMTDSESHDRAPGATIDYKLHAGRGMSRSTTKDSQDNARTGARVTLALTDTEPT